MESFNILMIGGLMPNNPYAGGGQRYSYSLAHQMAKYGNRIDYITFDKYKLNYETKINILQLEYNLFSSLANSLNKSLDDYDIIHLHTANENFSSCVGYSIKKYFNSSLNLIVQFHGPQAYFPPRSIEEIAYICSLKAAKAILSVSNYSKNNISKSYLISQDKIKVAYAGVNDRLLEKSISKKDADLKLLFVGRFGDRNEQKGLDILLKSMPFVLKENDVKLSIVGQGNDRKYRSLINKLNLKEKIKFYNFVSDDKLVDLYSCSHLFVLPSRRESFGLVLAEAMACKLPVVSTKAGAIPEVVKDKHTGILVPTNDPYEFAKAINLLLGDPQLMHEMGSNGRERVKDHFTWDITAKRIINSYKDMMI